MRPKHKILVAEDDVNTRKSLISSLDSMGHIPIPVSNAQEAINLMESTEGQYNPYGVPNHRILSLILSDYLMKGGNADELLRARNDLDPLLPFILYSGQATPLDTTKMGRSGLTDFLPKPTGYHNLENMIDSILIDTVEVNKPVLMFKMGGSADDYNSETVSKAYFELLDFSVHLQKIGYQVIWSVGAGVQGDKWKGNLKRCGDREEVRKGHPHRMVESLESNMKHIRDIIGSKYSIYVTPEQMTGQNEGKFGDNPLEQNIHNILEKNKVIIAGVAPRHLTLEWPEIVGKDSSNYPNIPWEDSDAMTALIADLFEVGNLRFVKRTTGLFASDPYKGFKRGIDTWAKTQEGNIFYPEMNLQNLIEGYDEQGNPISRIGAWDNDDNHLCETTGLKLIYQSDRVNGLHVFHIDPIEMFIEGGNTKKPTHVYSGAPWPDGIMPHQLREYALWKSLGSPKPDGKAINFFNVEGRDNNLEIEQLNQLERWNKEYGQLYSRIEKKQFFINSLYRRINQLYKNTKKYFSKLYEKIST